MTTIRSVESSGAQGAVPAQNQENPLTRLFRQFSTITIVRDGAQFNLSQRQISTLLPSEGKILTDLFETTLLGRGMDLPKDPGSTLRISFANKDKVSFAFGGKSFDYSNSPKEREEIGKALSLISQALMEQLKKLIDGNNDLSPFWKLVDEKNQQDLNHPTLWADLFSDGFGVARNGTAALTGGAASAGYMVMAPLAAVFWMGLGLNRLIKYKEAYEKAKALSDREGMSDAAINFINYASLEIAAAFTLYETSLFLVPHFGVSQTAVQTVTSVGHGFGTVATHAFGVFYVTLAGIGAYRLATNGSFRTQFNAARGEGTDEAIGFLKNQVTLTETELATIRDRVDDPEKYQLEIGRRLRGKWERFARLTDEETLKDITRDIHTVTEETRKQEIIQMVEKANFKKIVTAIFYIVIGLTGLVVLLTLTGPVGYAMFAVLALSYFLLDAQCVNKWTTEGIWKLWHSFDEEKKPLLQPA